MNALIRTQAVRFGTIGGAITVAYFLVGYLFYQPLFTSVSTSLLVYLVYLGLLIFSGIDTKRKFGGFISFQSAFSVIFLSSALMGLVGAVFTILLFGVIDPEFAVTLNEMVIESSVSMMEKFGTPPSQIEEVATKLQENPQFSVMNQVKGFFTGLVIYAVLAAVIGALIKKNKPEFEA
jgi:hypothetical protein